MSGILINTNPNSLSHRKVYRQRETQQFKKKVLLRLAAYPLVFSKSTLVIKGNQLTPFSVNLDPWNNQSLAEHNPTNQPNICSLLHARNFNSNSRISKLSCVWLQ